MTQFNVLWWGFNDPSPSYYDVLPYFRRCYESCRKKDKPVTKEQWTEFVKNKGIYMYLSKCQYEFLVSKWPPHVDPEKDVRIKVDIYQQIEANLDLVVKLLMEEYCYGSK